MYFKIATVHHDPDFSWILYKNPGSIFERDLKQGVIRARFLDAGQTFEGSFTNDPIAFVKAMKQANLAHYVHFQLAGVCPSNLMGFEECFRSAISGNVSSALTEERFFASKELAAVIGPYPAIDVAFFQEVWAAFGITATRIEDDGTEVAHMWKFTGTISVTDFLQKIYLLSYYFTERQRIHYIQSAMIEKFARRCAGWFAQCADQRIKAKILKRICKFNPKFLKLFKVTFEALQVDETADEEKDAPPSNMEAFLEKRDPSLHEHRHDLIVKEIADFLQGHDCTDVPVILDWGMGDAKLTTKLDKKLGEAVKLRGMDANEYRIRKAKQRVPRGHFQVQNLLFPCEIFNPTVLVHCEVIEHMPRLDRFRALKIMRDYYQPQFLILTTPNFEHNTNWDGLIVDGEIQYRHGDHKIEYTRAEFEREVVSYLEKDYEVEFRDILNLDEYEPRTEENAYDPDIKTLRVFNQPTFIIVCRRKKRIRQASDHSPIARNYHTLTLPISGTEIYGNELVRGFSDRAILVNGSNITYLGPTVPPVDFNPAYPNDLEHPMTALQYYQQRGIHEVVIEKKHMGSRATVLVFRTKEIAELFGFETPVVVTSRKGFPFFRDDDQEEYYRRIYDEIAPKLERDGDDFVMLDCEMLPWRYKAPHLITNEFLAPGESAKLFRQYTNQDGVDRAERYLDVLSWFTQDAEVSAKMFQLLLKGKVEIRDGKLIRMKDAVLGSAMHRLKMYEYLETIKGRFFDFEPGTLIFDLGKTGRPPSVFDDSLLNLSASHDLFEESLEKVWKIITETQRCEGVVVKPVQFFNQMPSGYWVQPMLKVRGMPYLHLIYGIDIMNPAYFKQLTYRKIKIKRIQAITQHELGDFMLRAFIHLNPYLRQRIAAAFFGNEYVKFNDLDKTL